MRLRPSRPPLDLGLDSSPLILPVCHVVISLLAHRRSCTRLNSDISDPTPTTRPGYPLEGLLMERPPPPNLKLDSRILAIRTELFGSTGVPHLSDDRGAPMRSSAPRGGTDVKYNHSLFAGLSHLFDV